MKTYDVGLLPIAGRDVENILDYIAVTLSAPSAALNLHHSFSAAFQRLKEFPLSGNELKTDLPLKYRYRWLLVESYMVFYTVDDAKGTVTVMRVLYGASDYLSVL